VKYHDMIASELYPMKNVQGREFLEAKDSFYLVKDTTDSKLHLYLSEDTKLDRGIRAGDRIEALVSSDGHAIFIRAAREALGEHA